MKSPLERAIEQRRLTKVRELVEQDRSLLVRELYEDCLPLYLCSAIHARSIFDYMAEKLTPRQLHSKKAMYLHYAAHYGFGYGIKKLIALGVSPNMLDPQRHNAIFYATWGHQEKMITLLAQLGTEVNHEVMGNTPLHAACAEGELACAKALVHAGADINHVAKGAGTPLALAAAYGRMEIVQFLLGVGANPRRKDLAGHTATYDATRYGHRDIAAVLKAAVRQWKNLNLP